MSLDRPLRTRRISLIKPSLGHITYIAEAQFVRVKLQAMCTNFRGIWRLVCVKRIADSQFLRSWLGHLSNDP